MEEATVLIKVIASLEFALVILDLLDPRAPIVSYFSPICTQDPSNQYRIRWQLRSEHLSQYIIRIGRQSENLLENFWKFKEKTNKHSNH